MLAIYSRAFSKNLGQRSILAIKSTFLWKRALFFQKRTPKISPYSIPFLSVLHQNKALYDFWKKWQLSIVERNIGLKYDLYRFFVKIYNQWQRLWDSHPLPPYSMFVANMPAHLWSPLAGMASSRLGTTLSQGKGGILGNFKQV